MSKKTYHEWMIAAGWQKEMLDGEAAFEIDMEDRVLQSVPQFSKTASSFTFIDHASVWVEDWARARHRIFPNFPIENCSILRRKNSRNKVDGSGSAEFIAEVTRMLRDWAADMDKAAEIERHAQERERYGLLSFDHITALAMLGRTGDLEQWRQRVAEGKAEGLHPMVDTDAMDRAIALSKEHQ